MKCNPILGREDCFITDRKPTICLRCGKKEVIKSFFGMPTAEDYYEAKYHFQGCITDFQEQRTWGCCKCDAVFWKDKKHNLAPLGGLLTRQWPEQDKKYLAEEIPF